MFLSALWLVFGNVQMSGILSNLAIIDEGFLLLFVSYMSWHISKHIKIYFTVTDLNVFLVVDLH